MRFAILCNSQAAVDIKYIGYMLNVEQCRCKSVGFRLFGVVVGVGYPPGKWFLEHELHRIWIWCVLYFSNFWHFWSVKLGHRLRAAIFVAC